jgi:hypothetical protein
LHGNRTRTGTLHETRTAARASLGTMTKIGAVNGTRKRTSCEMNDAFNCERHSSFLMLRNEQCIN